MHFLGLGRKKDKKPSGNTYFFSLYWNKFAQSLSIFLQTFGVTGQDGEKYYLGTRESNVP
jgi:hypothetical protein